ncbi:MAG TPA: extracellular solute-binding protein, partial [Gaiellales bacterium]|nr:extracellular solute-binding protein [Gaiellales bacterium]
MKRHLAKKHLAIVAAIATMITAAGCGGTPGSSPGSGGAKQSGAVTTSGFDKLGPVHLTIWSYDNQDPGLEPVLKELSANFEKQYPNVKIDMVFKDFNSLVNVVPRALASGSGPDITEGNQGYQTDAQLVKAKLIVPLDPYIKAYGWQKWYSPSTWSMFRWTDDGKTFGQGPTWGVAQTGQNINVY